MELRLRAAALSAVVLACVLPGIAHAGPIRECGNYGLVNGHERWTYGQIDGGGIFNVTSRVVRCRTARRVARHAYSKSGKRHYRYKHWKCHVLHEGLDYADTRCTRSRGRVVRWQVRA